MTSRPLLLSFARGLCLLALAVATLTAFAPRAGADDVDPEPRSLYPRTTDLDRALSAKNLGNLGLAMHNYHDANGALPGAAILDKNGKPLLSWRVAVLPYVEELKLYQEFKLDEPWDSKHNKTLIAKMPKLYAPTIQGKPKKPNTTYYQVFTGPDALFTTKTKFSLRFQNVTDGTSNTAMIVEAAEPVVWSKPDDVAYDAKKALPKLGGLFAEGFHVTVGDGSARWIGRKTAKQAALRALITPAGGEVFSWNDLPEPEKKK
jgi:hypothetical protein